MFKRIKINSIDAFIDAEIMIKAKQLGYTVTEIGVFHLLRKDGISTGARPSVIFRTIHEIFQYRKEYLREINKKN